MVKENEDKQVAALKYNKEKNTAPEIVALGKRRIAEQIINTAKESGVPIYKNAPLAESLNKMALGQEIPPALYEIVAQVLIYVAELDRKRNW
jgi:flagellar biosynthesis protein